MANLNQIMDYTADYINDTNNRIISEWKQGSAISVSAGGRGNLTVDVAKAGFTPLGIGSVTINGNATAFLEIGQILLSGTTVTVTVHNSNSSAQSWRASVLIIYKKD